MKPKFYDREEAGRLLADRLASYSGHPDLLVLAIPRGGVPVAHAIARALGAPLDVMVVRKLGVPGHEELALGAIGSGGTLVVNPDVIAAYGLSQETISQVEQQESRELARRELAYRGHRPPCVVAGNTVILVDDGIATGATIRAALAALRSLAPKRLIVAAPVIARDACARLQAEADEIVAVHLPAVFHSVGEWFEIFPQVPDRQVQALLGRPCPPASGR